MKKIYLCIWHYILTIYLDISRQSTKWWNKTRDKERQAVLEIKQSGISKSENVLDYKTWTSGLMETLTKVGIRYTGNFLDNDWTGQI